VAHLLNPSFCGLLLRAVVAEYVRESKEGLPFALAFLVLPVVLHKATRDALPTSVATSLLGWLQDHPEARVGFAERTRSLVPFTQEALRFVLGRGVLALDDGGALRPGAARIRSSTTLEEESEEVRACLQRARLLGRWFARGGNASVIFRLWGIAP
jgi:hypothetical protein